MDIVSRGHSDKVAFSMIRQGDAFRSSLTNKLYIRSEESDEGNATRLCDGCVFRFDDQDDVFMVKAIVEVA